MAKKCMGNWSFWNPYINEVGGGFKHFLFSSLLGGDSHFDEHSFQMGWFNHQLVKQGGPLLAINGVRTPIDRLISW